MGGGGVIYIIITFLAHSIQSSLNYWQRNSWKWRLASQLYSGYSIICLIDLSLSNLALNFPTSCSPTLACTATLYFLFIKNKKQNPLYTADCRNSRDSCPTDKFTDDTGLFMNDDNSHYRQEVDRFVDWWDTNCLVLNVGKTKIIDFRRKKPNDNPIMVKGEAVCWAGGQILLFRLKTNLPGTKTPMNSWRKSTFVSFVLENLDHSEWVRIFCRCFSCPLLSVF